MGYKIQDMACRVRAERLLRQSFAYCDVLQTIVVSIIALLQWKTLKM